MSRVRGAAAALVRAAPLFLMVLSLQVATARGQGAARIAVAELKKLHAAGTVVVVDVRSAAAYREAHAAGALSAPLDVVASRAAELKAAGKTVVTYCT